MLYNLPPAEVTGYLNIRVQNYCFKVKVPGWG